jgi:hypothetical protein
MRFKAPDWYFEERYKEGIKKYLGGASLTEACEGQDFFVPGLSMALKRLGLFESFAMRRERKRVLAFGLWHLGHSIKDAADIAKFSANLLARELHNYGFIPTTYVKSKKDFMVSERTQDIVALREGGGTYQAIGDKWGISRERVRQILHKCGRSDLCHRRKGPTYRFFCDQCGKENRTQKKARQEGVCGRRKFCNRICMDTFRRTNLTEIEQKIFDVIVEVRPAMTWKEVAETLEIEHWTGLPSRFKDCCTKLDIDPSPWMTRN